jgi:hypothetical protein
MARSLLCARAVALISCSLAPTQVRLTARVPAPHPEASCSGAQLPAPSASSFPAPSPCFSLPARSASEVPPRSTCSQCLWFRLQFGAWSSLSVLSAERFSCARAQLWLVPHGGRGASLPAGTSLSANSSRPCQSPFLRSVPSRSVPSCFFLFPWRPSSSAPFSSDPCARSFSPSQDRPCALPSPSSRPALAPAMAFRRRSSLSSARPAFCARVLAVSVPAVRTIFSAPLPWSSRVCAQLAEFGLCSSCAQSMPALCFLRAGHSSEFPCVMSQNPLIVDVALRASCARRRSQAC